MMRRIMPLLGVILTAALLTASDAQAQSSFDENGQCVGDADADDQVSVNELVQSVNNLLRGCELMPVTLRFQAKVGEEPFACGNVYEGVGLSSSRMIPADFRFYISEVQLLNTDGNWIPLRLDQDGIWQVENLAMLDFENKEPPCALGTVETNDTVRGMAPPGEYVGVRFTLGIPFRLNHQDSALAPSPLNLTAMFWSWQGGYKFIRVDTADDSFRIHLGSSGCEARSPTSPPTLCTRPNRGEVILPEFNPATQTIVADLAALLAESDLETNAPETPPGCMAGSTDPDCEPIFRNFGINFENGLPDASRQKFFRLE